MEEQDRKLDRAETERIELMEVCPVCGEQRRNSARFCTTCGHRFATDEIENTPVASSPESTKLPVQDGTDPVISGWPAPSVPAASSPWAPAATENNGWPSPPIEPASYTTSPEVAWASVAATASENLVQQQPDVEESSGFEIDEGFVVVEDADSGSVPGTRQRDEQLRLRARMLLNELREAIEGLTGGPATVNEALARELEISLTQPTALEGDAIADLRTAAEAAQSRPRDLDTLTALTAQADTILALIVGYERSTAGIERAIQSLRGGPGHSESSDEVENLASRT